jgi:hypothetical protein
VHESAFQEWEPDSGRRSHWPALVLATLGAFGSLLLVAATTLMALLCTWSSSFTQMWAFLTVPLVVGGVLALAARGRFGALAMGARAGAFACIGAGGVALVSVGVMILIET